MLFGRRGRRRAAHQEEQIESARKDIESVERLQKRLRAQEPEINDRTERLEERRVRNHFAESMYLSMGKRLEGS